MDRQPTVLKFGGTSVEDTRAFARVREIVAARLDARPLVIVSAMSRVTDALLMSIEGVARGEMTEAARSLEQHYERHRTVARELLPAEAAARFELTLAAVRAEIKKLLQELADDNTPRPSLQDLILSYGERLSATLLAETLRAGGVDARYVDARRCLITDEEHGCAAPLMEETAQHARAEIEPLLAAGLVPVLGGFIGATQAGATTTLGRGGSDYSAAIFGAALHAREIQIWTDVPGVLTADPRLVPNARTISRLSYAEAAELAFFGAKVLHPKTILPAVVRGIPVRICNSRDTAAPATVVYFDAEMTPRTVKAIAFKKGVTIVHVTSARMLGAYGFLRAIFEVFDEHRTAVDVIATSEVSVSLTLEDTSALDAVARDLQRVGAVRVEPSRAIISIVGEGLRSTPGIAARAFHTIRDINVLLISQGASSTNLTFVVAEEHAAEVVVRLHEAFFECPTAELVVPSSKFKVQSSKSESMPSSAHEVSD